MRLSRFPFRVQNFLSSGDILAIAAEDGTRTVIFWFTRDHVRPDSCFKRWK